MITLPANTDNPLDVFQSWLSEAEKAEDSYPNAFTFASVNGDGQPSARTLLLKGMDHDGFVFFTNGESRKGDDIRANPHGAMLFYWKSLKRQIRIEGLVEKITLDESDAYFATRPRESQIGAWASAQSRPLSSYDDFLKKIETIAQKYDGHPIPRPPYWTGYRLTPARIEFWLEENFRLHRRFLYEKNNARWQMTLLNP
jgi:pyridoxamine 5'-phosphate oxidase